MRWELPLGPGRRFTAQGGAGGAGGSQDCSLASGGALEAGQRRGLGGRKLPVTVLPRVLFLQAGGDPSVWKGGLEEEMGELEGWVSTLKRGAWCDRGGGGGGGCGSLKVSGRGGA